MINKERKMDKSLITSTKKKKPRVQADPNAAVWGDVNPESSDYKMAKHWAFVWMANNLAIKDFRDETIKYSKKNRKEQMRKFNYSSIPPYHFMTIGKYCYAMNHGASFAQDTNDWLEDKWAELEQIGITLVKESIIETVKKPVVSIQERIRDQIGEYIAEIEEQVDIFSEGGYKSDFDMYKWLLANNVKSQQANAIGEYYVSWRDELAQIKTSKLVHPSSDEQLVEGYSYMKPAQVKKFVEFLDGIINDAITWSNNQKKTKKPKKKRERSVDQILKHFKFKESDPAFKVQSVNASQIIGASELWVLHTGFVKKIGVYRAIDRGGLQINRSSITNFNTSTSIEKRIGKSPEDVIKKVVDGGKISLRKLTSTLRAKDEEPNGRINNNTILLRVIK